MSKMTFSEGPLTDAAQRVVNAGFRRDADQSNAPHYAKQSMHWTIVDDDGVLVAALAADILWDWMYIDELWTDESVRGQGLGRRLMAQAEVHATERGLTGIWLWTQSWQAARFYEKLEYEEFARFPDFPRGHERLGFRKLIVRGAP